MDYWRGYMSWPLVKGWECEICGASGGYLIWGFVHARCRCDQCHTQYHMRDEESKVVNKPILMLKPECVGAAKTWWANTQEPISKAPQDYWEPFLTEPQ